MPYHSRALSLLKRPLTFSPELTQELAHREEALGVRFPASFREWYSLDGAPAVQTRQDHPVPAEALELAHDATTAPMLVIMHENQGVCRWGIPLTGADDPEVLVEIEDSRRRGWVPFAASYSQFVLTQVWEWGENMRFGMSAQEQYLAENDLAFLRQHFTALPETYNWPGAINYRFENALGKVMVWKGEHQVDWFIYSHQEQALKDLVMQIWHCGRLVSTLYAVHDTTDEFLKDIRKLR